MFKDSNGIVSLFTISLKRNPCKCSKKKKKKKKKKQPEKNTDTVFLFKQ